MGTVVSKSLFDLMGGDEFRQNCIPMDRELLRHVSHQPPRVVIVPTAAAPENPRLAAENGIRYFQALGAVATAVMIIDRKDAHDPRQLAQFKEADSIYLTGGNPSYLLECLRDSVAWAAIKELYQQGGMVVGSSAGAMVLSERMHTTTAGWVPALGLATRVAVLPHHEHQPNMKIKLLRQGLESHIVILGIEVATACVSHPDGSWEVVGVGSISVYIRDKAYRYSPNQSFELP